MRDLLDKYGDIPCVRVDTISDLNKMGKLSQTPQGKQNLKYHGVVVKTKDEYCGRGKDHGYQSIPKLFERI